MNIAQLIARLGAETVARRVGVTPATVRRWGRRGVSDRYRDRVAGVAARHERSAKGAETRRKRFQDSLPAPAEPYIDLQFPRLGQTLPLEDVLPTRKPKQISARESERYESTRYMGRIYYVSIDSPALDVSADEISDMVLAAWLRNGTTFCWVEFIFFRYIPFNPIYKGELTKKQGTWDVWYASTPARATSREISRAIENVMADAHFAAQRRMQWLSAIKIYLLDEK